MCSSGVFTLLCWSKVYPVSLYEKSFFFSSCSKSNWPAYIFFILHYCVIYFLIYYHIVRMTYFMCDPLVQHKCNYFVIFFVCHIDVRSFQIMSFSVLPLKDFLLTFIASVYCTFHKTTLELCSAMKYEVVKFSGEQCALIRVEPILFFHSKSSKKC